MANHCWNWASIEGSKENLDRFEAALISAKGDTGHLWYESYFTALSSPLPSKTGDAYADFGTRWFDAEFERVSETSANLSGSSAWSPPLEFFRRVSEVYDLSVTAEYEESGCDFGGFYECTNGEVHRDDCYTYWQYRFVADRHHAVDSLCEDIRSNCFESLEDLQSTMGDTFDSLSKTEIEEINEAFESVTK